MADCGIGLETFQRFNCDEPERRTVWTETTNWNYDTSGPLHHEDHPFCSVAYFRFAWGDLEPEPGQYDWSAIDGGLVAAERHGQQFHFGIVPHNHTWLMPKWVKEKCRLIPFVDNLGRYCILPDYEDKVYRTRLEAFVGEMGQRYDGHPNLRAVDIRSLGAIGEWTNLCCIGDPMGTPEIRRWGVDIYLRAFKKTPLVMHIAGREAFGYAVEHGCGWRNDGWGNPALNHWIEHDWLDRYGARDAWKNGPVVMETWGDWGSWEREGWDFQRSFDLALHWHATLINGKSFAFPEKRREEILAFIRQVEDF